MFTRIYFCLFALLSSSLIYAIEPVELYCGQELDWSKYYVVQGEDFILRDIDFLDTDFRDFVLPDTGVLERCAFPKGLTGLAKEEMIALEAINSKLWWPAITMPIVLQLSSAKEGSPQHVESLCLIIQDGLTNFWDPPLSLKYIPMSADITECITALSHLRYLEVFGLKAQGMDSYGYESPNIDFQQLSKLQELEYFGIPHDAEDEHIKHISSYKKLKFLNASNTKIKGKTLYSLGDLPNLATLDLRRTSLDRGVLSGLAKCSSLKTLMLSESNITDIDLKDVALLKSLEYLTLHKTDITDKGLKHLSALKNLKYISLANTKITDAAIETLKSNFSELQINTGSLRDFDAYLHEAVLSRAFTGDIEMQRAIFQAYERTYRAIGKIKTPITKVAFNSAHERYLNELTVPDDRVGFLKWSIVLSERKSQKDEPPVKYYKDYVEKLKSKLDKAQVSQAYKKANAILNISEKADVKYKIKRREGLPTYQYYFDGISSDEEYRKALRKKRIEQRNKIQSSN